MFLTDVWDLFTYWAKNPPTHIILAARYGIRSEGDHPDPTATEQNFLAMATRGPVRTFDNAPVAVQAAFEKMRKKNG